MTSLWRPRVPPVPDQSALCKPGSQGSHADLQRSHVDLQGWGIALYPRAGRGRGRYPRAWGTGGAVIVCGRGGAGHSSPSTSRDCMNPCTVWNSMDQCHLKGEYNVKGTDSNVKGRDVKGTKCNVKGTKSNFKFYEVQCLFIVHLKLWIAVARHNFEWMKICSLWSLISEHTIKCVTSVCSTHSRSLFDIKYPLWNIKSTSVESTSVWPQLRLLRFDQSDVDLVVIPHFSPHFIPDLFHRLLYRYMLPIQGFWVVVWGTCFSDNRSHRQGLRMTAQSQPPGYMSIPVTSLSHTANQRPGGVSSQS